MICTSLMKYFSNLSLCCLPTKLSRCSPPRMYVESPQELSKYWSWHVGPVEQNWEPRNELTHLWSNNFLKGAKVIQQEKNNLNKWCSNNFTHRRRKVGPFLISHTKIHSKQIKTCVQELKLWNSQNKTGEYLYDLGLSNDFSDTESKAQW